MRQNPNTPRDPAAGPPERRLTSSDEVQAQHARVAKALVADYGRRLEEADRARAAAARRAATPSS